MSEQTAEESIEILNTIDRLMRKVNISICRDWRSYGLNLLWKDSRGAVLVVDYDIPEWLLTPEGRYTVNGGMGYAGTALHDFWDLMYQEFDITELSPKRDDTKIGDDERRNSYSGPCLLIQFKGGGMERTLWDEVRAKQ